MFLFVILNIFGAKLFKYLETGVVINCEILVTESLSFQQFILAVFSHLMQKSAEIREICLWIQQYSLTYDHSNVKR